MFTCTDEKITLLSKIRFPINLGVAFCKRIIYTIVFLEIKQNSESFASKEFSDCFFK
jgi:hypothetical protein